MAQGKRLGGHEDARAASSTASACRDELALLVLSFVFDRQFLACLKLSPALTWLRQRRSRAADSAQTLSRPRASALYAAALTPNAQPLLDVPVIMLISAKVWKAELFYRYLHGLSSFHTGLSTGTVEGQPASYAFWTTLSFHTLAENTRIGFAHSAFSACKVCRNFADLVHFAPGFCEAGSGMTPLRGMSRSDRGEIGIQKEKSPSIGDFSFWVPGGTRTHDIQNHNLTL